MSSKGLRSTSARTVRLFKNGRSQALRIPKEYELPGKEATIRKLGTQLILEPVASAGLVATLKKLKPCRARFPTLTDLPPDEVDL